MIKRLILLFIAIVCLFPGVPVQAEPSIFHAIEHNVAGYNTGAIMYSARVLQPLTIAASEVCGTKYNEIDDELAALGYTPAVYLAVSKSSGNGVCDEDEPLYNVVATKGTYATGDVWRIKFPMQQSSDISSTTVAHRNYRGFVCLRASFIFRQWLACSTHMASSIGSVADAQAGYLRTYAINNFNQIAHILGGDYNRQPCQGQGAGGPYDQYDSYREADQTNTFRLCNTQYWTFDGTSNTKIDYIWTSKFFTMDLFGVAERKCGPPHSGSDHCYYHGAFQWP